MIPSSSSGTNGFAACLGLFARSPGMDSGNDVHCRFSCNYNSKVYIYISYSTYTFFHKVPKSIPAVRLRGPLADVKQKAGRGGFEIGCSGMLAMESLLIA